MAVPSRTLQRRSGRDRDVPARATLLQPMIPTSPPTGPTARFTRVTAWLCACVAVLLGASSAAQAATFHVDGSNPACSDGGPGSVGIPYCTIDAAVDAEGGPGTTILVQPGTYREQVTISAGGTSGSPLAIRAQGAVTIDGSDDFSSTGLWSNHAGDVFLAASVDWDAKQVFVDGARLAASTASASSIPAGTFRYILGEGLYINLGGDNPGTHTTYVSYRSYGFRASEKTYVTIEGFTIERTNDRGIYFSTNSDFAEILDNVVRDAYRAGIQVSNSADALIRGNTASNALDHGIALINGTNGAIENNVTYGHAKPVPTSVASGIYLSGSTNIDISGNRISDNTGSGLYIQSSSNNRSIQNASWNNGRRGYDMWHTTGMQFIGDVAYGNTRSGFAMRGTSTGASLYNCIGVDNGLPMGEWNLQVDASASTGFVSDDNLWWNATAQDLVDYAGTEYATVAAFTAATGHGTRTLEADPLFEDASSADFHLRSGSLAIDAANSSVPNWPALDAEGLPRNDDAGTPNTGLGPVTYADRGAHERQGVPAIPPTAALFVTPLSGPAPLNVTADASGSTPGDTAIVSYTFDFGDGMTAGPQASAIALHTYAVGQWMMSVTVTDADGDTATAVEWVNVFGGGNPPNATIDTPVKDLVIAAGQPVFFTASGEDFDGDLPLSFAWDFGGGATNSSLEDPEIVTFDIAGVYTVTLTVTDTTGNFDPTPAIRTITVTQAPALLPADEVHWTVIGETAVSFYWRGSATSIQYGPTPAYGQSVNAVTPAPVPPSSAGPHWEAKLTGLLPNTVYHYSIGGSPDQTFKTAHVRGTSDFTAVSIGDVGSILRYEHVELIAAQIASVSPNLLLHTGDITYGDDHGDEAVDQAFNDAMIWSRETAFMPSWGNHDWGGNDLDNYKGRFDLPNPQTSTPFDTPGGEDWYWYDYGNVRFIVYPEQWDSGVWQDDWSPKAESLMTEAQTDPDIDFIVTYGHRPAYSSGNHGSNTTLRPVLDSLGTRFPKYVLNLQAHSHNYERTHPQHGVIHVTVGNGGASLGGVGGSCVWEGGCPPPAFTAFRAMHHGFTKLTFTATGILGEAICGPPDAGENDITCEMGSVFDSFTIGNPDRSPTVAAPAAAAIDENAMVTVQITADDPDGETITTLMADLSNLPAGHDAVFVPAFDNKSGTLTWTPTFDDAGSYDVTFSASNGLIGQATTTITVEDVDRAPALTAPANATAAEAESLVVAVTVSDPDGEAITSLIADLSNLPAGHAASFTPHPGNASGTLVWVPTFDHAGTYDVTFIVSNARADTATTSLTITPVDRAPGVVSPLLASVAEAGTLSIVIGASDPDGDAISSLTADLSALPSGHSATFTPGPGNTSGTFSWSPDYDAAGSYAVTFTAANALSGDDVTTINVSNVDRSPAIAVADTSGPEGALMRVQVTANDPDGDPITTLTADLAGLPSGHDATFTPSGDNTSGTFEWTPTFDDSGRYVVTFSAFNALSGQKPATVTVINTDRAPKVMAPSSVSGAENEPTQVVVSASDVDGDAITSLSADLSDLPAGHGATFTPSGDNTSGTLDWTPAFGDTGAYDVTFTAQNALDGDATTTLTISNTDRGPVVTAPASVQTGEGQLLSVVVTASDPDGDPIGSLTADLSALPLGHGATFTADPGNTSGTLNWTPGFDHAGGPYAVTFTASNALSGGAMTSITVNDVDRAPIVTAPATVGAQRGELLTVNVTASDPDGDPIGSLTVDLSGLPAGHDAAFIPAPGNTSATFTWTPAAGDIGDYSVLFTAANALQDTAHTLITVSEGDRAPIISAPPSIQAAENKPLTLIVTATDPDGDPIDSLKADYGKFPPGNAAFQAGPGNTTGTFTWTPQPGNGAGGSFYFVFFMAHNSMLGEAATVVFVDQAPVLTAPPSVTALAGSLVTVGVTVSDPDGDDIDSLIVDTSGLPAGHNAIFLPDPGNVGGRLVWTPAFDDTGGSFPVTFRAVNNTWSEQSTTIDVMLSNGAPVAHAQFSMQSGVEPLPVTIDASGSTDPENSIATYTFDFGDGTVIGPQASPLASHHYPQGTWNAQVTVRDIFGAEDTLTVPVTAYPNLCSNPILEFNGAGWNAYRGSTVQRVGGGGYIGDHVLEIHGPATTIEFGANDSPDFITSSSAAGTRYRYSVMVRSLTHTGSARIRVREYNGGSQQGVTTHSPAVTLSPEWQQISVDYVAQASGSSLNMQIVNQPQVQNEVFQLDYMAISVVEDGVTGIFDPVLTHGLRASVRPNPSRGRATLHFTLPAGGPVTVHLFDLHGRAVRNLVDGEFLPGTYEVSLGIRGRGQRLPSGIYFYRLQSRGGAATGRFVLLD